MFEPIVFDFKNGNQRNASLFQLKLRSGRKIWVLVFLFCDKVWCVQNPHIAEDVIIGFANPLQKQVIIPLMDGICLIREQEQRKLIMQRETYLNELMFLEHRTLSFGELFIFEAGVVALADDGELLWKANVYLNEKFKEERAGEIIFENTQDDYEFVIDKKNGQISR